MSKGRLLIVCTVWLVVLGGVALGWKLWFKPKADQAKQTAEEKAVQEEKDRTLGATSGSSRYKNNITFALDGFSGYAVFRSPEFQNELSRKGIKVELDDDGADYAARLEGLQSGKTQMAVFTVDALITASAKLGEIPATIITVIDETKGADAMVAYKKVIPNVDALNSPETRFILTPDSPSETLVRVLQAHFTLDQLSEDAFVKVNSAEEVYKKYRQSDPNSHEVFVLWQPWVTKILENPNTHVVIDSGRFRGYIVDVIVVNRDFLYKNQGVVKDFVEAYLRASYTNRSKMKQLVIEDARKLGAPLKDKQAEDLVKGIWWKNTQENFAHFGIQSGTAIQHIEDVIINITNVLKKTNAISGDPADGQANHFYYDGILRTLHEGSFHPGIVTEEIRGEEALAALADDEWDNLVTIGTLEVQRLVFARGTARLSSRSHGTLDELVKNLKTFPQYYVLVKGNASRRGDAQANQQLALDRAKAAQQYLTDKGIHKNRVKAVAGQPTGSTSVSFVLGQTPY